MSQLAMPSSDDQKLWALQLGNVHFPAVVAADELGVFQALAASPASAEELSQRMKLNLRSLRAILPLLASLGLLQQHGGRYRLTGEAHDYLLPTSPFYWGPVLAASARIPMSSADVVNAMRAPPESSRWDLAEGDAPVAQWSSGQLEPAMAKLIAGYMHANCLKCALVAAERVDLKSAGRLLDVGAGSGSFSIAFAQANPHLRCTLMDLQGMCDAAMQTYVHGNVAANRIDARAVDMFRQDWPSGYDAIFLSNILHDWDFATCHMLAKKAFAALPAGGHVLIHEMLLDDTHDGPSLSVGFSVLMLLGTKGQQFTGPELTGLLTSTGFVNVQITPCHGSYAVVSARKP